MLKLHELKSDPSQQKARKRVGRGIGSGTGKTSGRGQKGQKSRSGGNPHPWFEGGQMPLQRRLPKRGFTNIFRKEYEVVNLKQLGRLPAGEAITPERLKAHGLVRHTRAVKILANGEPGGALEVHAHKFSRSAVAKIEKAGGKAVVL